MGFAMGALAAHGATWLGGADVSARTFSQDLFGTIPLVGKIRNGGRIAHAVGNSIATNGLFFGGLMDSIVGTVEDPSALRYFIPTDGRQTGQMFLPGGPLIIGFENAWRQGGDG
ncbi:hypothetical protein [Streptomyces triticirhizae]|uniref:Uncharacterized protein n=1 Tax=Streptomyces triticirhizae TaxID=2483353 RepID=A0A3M2LK74_9ACTN|nr:hypothetical protein [Streptomyces triticirhizae]RMI37200.1 hypothetical protein EBN88_19635 [Streptomyces triticirhizae]